MTATDANKRRAEAQFKKAQRAEDGRQAMREYEAEQAAIRQKTVRLRELRLAHEAAVAADEAAAPKPTAPKRAKKTKRAA